MAASYNSYYPDLSLNRYKPAIYGWQYIKMVPGVADEKDKFSQEALNAGLDGHEHQNDTPARLKAMCHGK